MSGGVGPSSDIHLPQERIPPPEPTPNQHKHQIPTSAIPTTSRYHNRLFTLRQLNSLALITIISASGLVDITDFALAFFSTIYIIFLSRFSFPTSSPGHYSPVFSPDNRILRLYVLVGAIIGLYIPICYIFEGIYEGDKDGVKAAAPHVFLLATQVFVEGLVSAMELSIPIRCFVPVFYNSWRVTAIMGWLGNEIEMLGGGNKGGFREGSEWRLWIGKVLAVLNCGFWCFNLFGFLLPVYLPKAFERYYTAVAASSSSSSGAKDE